MTKEEIKEVMEEMECWSCDNHLNICDKHIFTDVEHEALTEVYRAKVGTPLQKALVDNPEAQKQLAEAILAVKNKATPKDCGCFESKSGTVEMFCPKHEDKDACIEPCNHDEVCGKCGKCFPDTPTPPSKECEHKYSGGLKTTLMNGRTYRVCEKCDTIELEPPPSKQPPRVSQTTRLEKIQAQHNNGVYHPESMSYLLSKLVTAVEVLEEIAHSLDGNYEEGWMANEVAAEAIKSINEDE